MDFKRNLNLLNLLNKKSFFLFGPRSTGKTFLINQQLSQNALILDLLNSKLYLRLSASPSELEAIIDSREPDKKIIVLDEIQRLPDLLHEVHRLIEERPDLRFLLTGSSARKLKKTHADMLAGRAWTTNLFPLTSIEIPNFNLERYLRFGGLPQVYKSADPEEELFAYIETYLKEEIRSEGLVRNLPPFSRFLKSAALSCGQLINFTEVGNDCQVAPSTVREYYSILEDTLVGFMLEPWIDSKKRKAISTAKFYFFDTGVTHALSGTKTLERNSNTYGQSFEQFIGMEIRAYLSYRRIQEPLTYWRSKHGFEVDFLIGQEAAIEIKATTRITPEKTKGLLALQEENVFGKLFIVSQDTISAKKNGVTSLHWKTFLDMLWSDKILA